MLHRAWSTCPKLGMKAKNISKNEDLKDQEGIKVDGAPWWRKVQQRMKVDLAMSSRMEDKPDHVPKVKINHPRSVKTDQEWSGEVADLDPMVQPKELTFHEQANPKMLRTADKTKWRTRCPSIRSSMLEYR